MMLTPIIVLVVTTSVMTQGEGENETCLVHNEALTTLNTPISSQALSTCIQLCIESKSCAQFTWKSSTKMCYLIHHEQSVSFLELGSISGSKVCANGCFNGWYQFEGRCYTFLPETIVFLEAVAKCKKLGDSHLPRITNGAQNTFLTNTMQQIVSNAHTGAPYFWLGLVRVGQVKLWHWMNGPIFDEASQYKNWAPTEPNSAADCSCVALDNTNGHDPMSWYDRYCHLATNAISTVCEIAAVSAAQNNASDMQDSSAYLAFHVILVILVIAVMIVTVVCARAVLKKLSTIGKANVSVPIQANHPRSKSSSTSVPATVSSGATRVQESDVIRSVAQDETKTGKTESSPTVAEYYLVPLPDDGYECIRPY